MAMIPLPLTDMDKRHHGLTPNVAECYLEAARVCLDRHHLPPQEFTLQDDEMESKVAVDWKQTDDRERAAWANNDDATRDGAYACAIAATEVSRGFPLCHNT